MSQIERIYKIDELIRTHQFPNEVTISEMFAVTERTAFADIKHFKEKLNAPIVRDVDRNGWMYSEPTYMLPFMALSETDAAALRRMFLAAMEYLDASDARVVEHIYRRLAPARPEGDLFDTVQGAVHSASSGAAFEPLVVDCRKAVTARHKMTLTYWGAHKDEVTTRTIHPYHLLNYRGEKYMIGWCELRGDIRHFMISRIREWRLLPGDAAFVRKEGFDLDAYLQRALGVHHGEEPVRVRVRFKPYQARWIRERTYHASQQIEELPDGALIITLHVAGMAEVQRWLMAYGSEAEVLEPAGLREEFAKEAKKLYEIYLD